MNDGNEQDTSGLYAAYPSRDLQLLVGSGTDTQAAALGARLAHQALTKRETACPGCCFGCERTDAAEAGALIIREVECAIK